MTRPLGIAASFSKVTFKKDSQEVYSAEVTSGGCFGPDRALDVANRAYEQLNYDINKAKAPATLRDFNRIAIGSREFEVEQKSGHRIEAIRPI